MSARTATRELGHRFADRCEGAVARGLATSDGPAERLAARTGSTALRAAGQRVDVVGAVLSLIIVAVIAYVGLDVIGEVVDTTGFDTSQDAVNRSSFENASLSLDSGISGAFGLMGVVFLVLLLSVIIGLFIGLRR